MPFGWFKTERNEIWRKCEEKLASVLPRETAKCLLEYNNFLINTLAISTAVAMSSIIAPLVVVGACGVVKGAAIMALGAPNPTWGLMAFGGLVGGVLQPI